MAKAKGPLFSLNASGSVGKLMTFSARKSGPQVRYQKKQKDVITDARTEQRDFFKEAVEAWNALSEEEKEEYNTRAKNLDITGYNLFISEYETPPSENYYLYVGGATTKTVRKYLKSDLSYVGETADYGGQINTVAVDDTHIYVGGGTTKTVRKYLKSDSSYVGQTASYGGNIQAVAIDDTHIYAGGYTTQTVRKYLKSDLSYIGETASYGGTIYKVAIDK